jgi:hypothetical protein
MLRPLLLLMFRRKLLETGFEYVCYNKDKVLFEKGSKEKMRYISVASILPMWRVLNKACARAIHE